MTTVSIAELHACRGTELPASRWIDVTQQRVNTFADATDDHQWIHVDVTRAVAESPFGGPIAHGYLTLSLLIPLWAETLTVTDADLAVNYGLNKVRFPAPVPVGARIRLRATITDVSAVSDGVQVNVNAVIESDGVAKPVCIAEPVFRFLRAQAPQH